MLSRTIAARTLRTHTNVAKARQYITLLPEQWRHKRALEEALAEEDEEHRNVFGKPGGRATGGGCREKDGDETPHAHLSKASGLLLRVT